jgi:hypothetical protein
VFHPEKLGIKNGGYWTGHRSEDNLEHAKEDETVSALNASKTQSS